METQTPAPQRPPSILTGIPPRDVLQKMLDTLGLKAKVETHSENGSLRLQIVTADSARLIGKHGQTLRQLQFLLNRMLQRANPGHSHVVVDCERYREQQHDDVLSHVRTTADKVRRWGEPLRLGPFSASERRVIHQEFDCDPELEVLSEPGDSDRKRILIRLRPTKTPM